MEDFFEDILESGHVKTTSFVHKSAIYYLLYDRNQNQIKLRSSSDKTIKSSLVLSMEQYSLLSAVKKTLPILQVPRFFFQLATDLLIGTVIVRSDNGKLQVWILPSPIIVCKECVVQQFEIYHEYSTGLLMKWLYLYHIYPRRLTLKRMNRITIFGLQILGVLDFSFLLPR